MAATLMDEEWRLLASFLPEGWRELARETGAMRRTRGEITSPEVLLQVLLLHVATGLSLKQAVARARVQGLASMSDVALLKRLRRSEGWLRELARRMFEAGRGARAGAGGPTAACRGRDDRRGAGRDRHGLARALLPQPAGDAVRLLRSHRR